jgi:enoyl-CoA hydratase/carnithine racemase
MSIEATEDEAVLYEARDTGVAVITLNRPERMNGWGGAIARGFYAASDRAEADPNVRVVVLTGAGRAFCAGADIGMMSTVGDSLKTANKDNIKDMVGERHPWFVTGLRKPVIAAINGACAGIGLTQALMCDVRFASAGAKFTTSFARRGLVAEYGISWILPRVVGWGAALDLLLSGRVFSAEEAAELGLVKEVVSPAQLMDRAVSYAEDIAAHCAPSSLAEIKRQVYGDAIRDIVDASARAESLMHDSMLRPDFIEGIMSFFEKRAPDFPPLRGKGHDHDA